MSFVICGSSTTEAKSWLSSLTYFLPPTAISWFLQCFWFSKVVCVWGFLLWLLLAPFSMRGLNLSVWHYSGGDVNNCLLTQVRNRWQTKARILPMPNLVGQWVLLELLTEMWVRGYSQELKELKDICIMKSPLQHGWQLTKAGNLEHSVCIQTVGQIGESLL